MRRSRTTATATASNLQRLEVAFLLSMRSNVRMGGWGYGCFENDDALDWVSNFFEGSSDYSAVMEALQAIQELDEDDYLEMPEAGAALAAAEVVAAAMGRPSPSLPQEIGEWVRDHPLDNPAEIAPMADQAVERVARNSEFTGNWTTPDGEARWQAVLADLRKRLKL